MRPFRGLLQASPPVAVGQEGFVGLVTGGGIWLRPALSLRESDIRDGRTLSFCARGTLRGGTRKDKGKGMEDDMWLGKVVNSVDLGGACKKKYVGKAQHIKGTRYVGVDWRVGVVWHERAGDNDERLTFREPPSDADVDFFNSTELRLVMLGGGGGAPVEVQGRERTLRLPGKTEANGRAWCR